MKVQYVEVIKCPVDSCDGEEFQTVSIPTTVDSKPCPDGGHYKYATDMLVRCLKCKKEFILTSIFALADYVPAELWEEK